MKDFWITLEDAIFAAKQDMLTKVDLYLQSKTIDFYDALEARNPERVAQIRDDCKAMIETVWPD